jgi:hypothetical protein
MEKKTVLWIALFLLGVSLACSGCAMLGKNKVADTENRLLSAGFVRRQPVTQEDLARLEKAQPLKLVRATRNGRVIYVYPDPYTCKCIYVGTEEQYQEFRRISQNIQFEFGNPQVDKTWEYGTPGGHDDSW